MTGRLIVVTCSSVSRPGQTCSDVAHPGVELFARGPRCSSRSTTAAAGRVRVEGKDYVMAEGDVVEFRFNV